MKGLLFHCRKWAVEFDSYANRPGDIKPESVEGMEEQECEDCVVAYVTVEKRDNAEKTSSGMAREIWEMCNELGRKNVVVCPFAHLSNNLADSDLGLKTLKLIAKKLEKKKLNVMRAHFGSNKSLLMDVPGHVGNARFREF